MRAKVVIDGIIYSLQRHGGISVYATELISRLQRDEELRHEVLVFTSAGGELLSRIHQKTAIPARLLERYRAIPDRGASIYHSTYYRVPSTTSGLLVTTVHDFIYERCVNGPRRWIHAAQKRRAIEKADAIVCISQSTMRDLFEFYPSSRSKLVKVIHNGVSELFRPNKLRAPQSAPYVLFVGARGGYKNFDKAVLAVSAVKELNLVAVGGGELSQPERALVTLHLAGRFSHRLGVSDEDLCNLYANAHCLLYPSAYEGFGIPILEAMRSTCPVIACNCSSIPEVAGAAAILLDEPDPELIAEALRALFSVECRDALIQSGLSHSRLFSWDETYMGLKRLYTALAS